MKTHDCWVTVYVGQIEAESREEARECAEDAFLEMINNDDGGPIEFNAVDVKEVEP